MSAKALAAGWRHVDLLKVSAKGVMALRLPEQTVARQSLPQFVGISEATVGAKGISMQLVVRARRSADRVRP
jgi:uncharacterized RmlC-like cupin family protein